MKENYKTITHKSGSPIKAWIRGVELEEEAEKQLRNIAQLSFIYKHIAVMPDVHWGLGATVGSVIPTMKAVIPAAVGVDIGCGMMATKTSLTATDLPDSLRDIRTAIEEAVPHGRTHHGRKGDRGAWQQIPKETMQLWDAKFSDRLQTIYDKHPKARAQNSVNHLGTLGTGNHFVEICLDEAQAVWVMLHSGSRGIGNRFGTYFIELAKRDMKSHLKDLPDANLAYLKEGTRHFEDYVEAVSWAQEFAMMNRQLMMKAILKALKFFYPDLMTHENAVNCHHNYLMKETHFGKEVIVTRKGAVRAQYGDLGIIPGSMGAKSFIVRGKGNPDSFMSCSHGAGRRMSRRKAKKVISIEDHKKATEGVECRKDKDVIDESPAAYKSIDAVMNAQNDLVDVVHELKQVICVKG